MFSLEYFVILSLVFARITGMFLLIPVFSTGNIPNSVKASFLFFLSIIVVPFVMSTSGVNYLNFIDFSYHLIIEFIIGLSFGMVCSIVLGAIYLAGAIVDRNIGFSMVNVISPMDQSEMPISANLYYIFAIMIFLFTNAHHILIRAILESVKFIPVGGDKLNLLLFRDFAELLKDSFIIGFRIAAPFIITILVANIILGLLSKAMPGMNVFIVGMPFKIFIGLLLFYLMIPIYYNSFLEIYDLIFGYLKELLNNYFL